MRLPLVWYHTGMVPGFGMRLVLVLDYRQLVTVLPSVSSRPSRVDRPAPSEQQLPLSWSRTLQGHTQMQQVGPEGWGQRSKNGVEAALQPAGRPQIVARGLKMPAAIDPVWETVHDLCHDLNGKSKTDPLLLIWQAGRYPCDIQAGPSLSWPSEWNQVHLT